MLLGPGGAAPGPAVPCFVLPFPSGTLVQLRRCRLSMPRGAGVCLEQREGLGRARSEGTPRRNVAQEICSPHAGRAAQGLGSREAPRQRRLQQIWDFAMRA